MKTCSRCGEERESTEFYRDARQSDGLSAVCRVCQLRYKSEARERNKARTDDEILAAAAARGSKTCATCKTVKDAVSEFPMDRGRTDGRGSHCKPCTVDIVRGFKERDPEGYRQRRKASHGRNRERYRKDQLKYQFGITPEQYWEMHAAQGGSCAICEQPETRKRNGNVCDLAVDHDHITGAVRQLLCSRCNTGLGWFRDSAEMLAKASRYVENHKNIQQRESPPA